MTRIEALRLTSSMALLSCPLVVALLVGTVLNAINRGDIYWSGLGLVWWRS